MAEITHNILVSYFQNLSEQHVDINSFYRFDIAEIQSKMKSGMGEIVLALEAAEISLGDNGSQNKTVAHTLAFSILGQAKADKHDEVNEMLDRCETIMLEVERRILKDSEDPTHWLYNRYSQNDTFAMKVGPIFSATRWGYRLSITLRNTDTKRMPNAAKWSDL